MRDPRRDPMKGDRLLANGITMIVDVVSDYQVEWISETTGNSYAVNKQSWAAAVGTRAMVLPPKTQP
jgi:hypothetical protein